MDKAISDKFTIYDFLGYLIPGTLILLALCYVYGTFNQKLPFKLNNAVLVPFVFIVVSYFLGILMHEFSQIIQKHMLAKEWGGLPSYRALTENSDIFSKDERQKYCDIALQEFNITVDPNKQCDSNSIYSNFKYALKQANKEYKAEVFDAHYGLCRNMLATAIVCIVIFEFLSIWEAFNGVCIYKNPYIFSFILSFVAAVLLNRRTKRYGEIYVKTVFRSYDQLYKETKNKNAII